GTDFRNKQVLNYLDQLDIKPLYTRSHTPTDNAISERFNRTIKVMLGKYLNSVNGEIIDNESLQKLVNSYNQTVHNSTNQKPIDIHPNKSQLKPKIVDQLQSQIYDKNKDRAQTILTENFIIQPKIVKGDSVRLHKKTQAKFRQGTVLKAKVYLPQYSYEIYKIAFVSKPNQTHSEQYEIYNT
ncbi:MAG: hypothetical protein ACK53Y_06795, partial [bacterium]